MNCRLVPRVDRGDILGDAEPGQSGPEGFDPFGWAADVTTLLAERATVEHRGTIEVDLPGTLSVSALVELADDPQQLALRLRRPVPREPAPQLRRGTAFHQWLERFFRGEALLDVRDLPGAGDVLVVDDAEFDELRRQFLDSPWANRVPIEIEVPFATRIAGVGVRGRIDAVFADADGGLTVVDWKTGRPPVAAAPGGAGCATGVLSTGHRRAQSGSAVPGAGGLPLHPHRYHRRPGRPARRGWDRADDCGRRRSGGARVIPSADQQAGSPLPPRVSRPVVPRRTTARQSSLKVTAGGAPRSPALMTRPTATTRRISDPPPARQENTPRSRPWSAFSRTSPTVGSSIVLRLRHTGDSARKRTFQLLFCR